MSISSLPYVGRRMRSMNLGLLGVGAAAHVEPAVVLACLRPSEVVRFHDQRVAFPPADRVAVPERLDAALRRQRPAVDVDVPQPVVRLVHDRDHAGVLHDLARLPMRVELRQPHREAIGVGVVFHVRRHPLLFQLGGPRSQRQATGDVRADFPERGNRRRVRIQQAARAPARAAGRLAKSDRSSGGSKAPFASEPHPVAGQIRLPIRHTRRRGVHANAALRHPAARVAADISAIAPPAAPQQIVTITASGPSFRNFIWVPRRSAFRPAR